MIAALFIDEKGPYSKRLGLDLWGVSRDARLYKGPHKAIAHPPCGKWSKLVFCRPDRGLIFGDDQGCFESALSSVRTWGGVLEHPEGSGAWAHFGLTKPPKAGGWVKADDQGGWVCSVEQGHYGHPARKATWLYVNKAGTPDLIWGPSQAKVKVVMMRSDKRHITPEPFLDVLLGIVGG